VVIVATAGYVVLMLKFKKVNRRWTAYCEELGTATFGRSLPEADKKLKEAILLHLNTLEDVGERRHFFEAHNIKLHHTKPKKDITVCLPLSKEVFIEPHIQAIPELSAA
jgi:predicted RNase H-like HicB family nuclease